MMYIWAPYFYDHGSLGLRGKECFHFYLVRAWHDEWDRNQKPPETTIWFGVVSAQNSTWMSIQGRDPIEVRESELDAAVRLQQALLVDASFGQAWPSIWLGVFEYA